jgi:curli biogenesis system outer membrane secretion channel CsgG
MAIEVRVVNTNNSNVLAAHELISSAEQAAGVADIASVWTAGPGTPSENYLKFIIRAGNQETVRRLRNRDIADEEAALNAARDAAEATYRTRFKD